MGSVLARHSRSPSMLRSNSHCRSIWHCCLDQRHRRARFFRTCQPATPQTSTGRFFPRNSEVVCMVLVQRGYYRLNQSVLARQITRKAELNQEAQ